MFSARNHTEFNAALNALAGTREVAYSAPWDMATHSGRDHMTRAYDAVGRLYAGARLSGEKLAKNRLYDGPGGKLMTPHQQLSLSAMQHSTDVAGFNAAVRAAAKYGALNALATSIFSAPVGVRAARVPDLGVGGIAVSAHADNMDVVDAVASGCSVVRGL